MVREIELTSYAEIVLQSLDADRQHPAYGNLFVQTEWIAANSAILATRRPKTNDEKRYWGAHVVAVGPERIGEVTYETDRAKFIGRGKSVRHPEASGRWRGAVQQRRCAARPDLLVACPSSRAARQSGTG